MPVIASVVLVNSPASTASRIFCSMSGGSFIDNCFFLTRVFGDIGNICAFGE